MQRYDLDIDGGFMAASDLGDYVEYEDSVISVLEAENAALREKLAVVEKNVKTDRNIIMAMASNLGAINEDLGLDPDDGGAEPILEAIAALREELAKAKQDVARLNVIINTPQDTDFLRAVSTEAEHQRQRWGSAHDAGKENSDWFWLIGYLAGKALRAAEVKNNVKAEHHIITTAAALANWHLAILRKTDMRPGIDGDAAMKVAG